MAHRKLPKAPKKPKHSAPYSSWQRYDQRVREWQTKCNKIIADMSKKNSLIKKHSGAPKLRHLKVA